MVIPREKNRNKNHLWRRETLYKSNATTFRRRRRRKESRRRRHERVGRESVKARRTVEDPRGTTTTTTTTTTTRELHRETGDVGVFLFLVGAWSFFIGENRSAASERRRSRRRRPTFFHLFLGRAHAVTDTKQHRSNVFYSNRRRNTRTTWSSSARCERR